MMKRLSIIALSLMFSTAYAQVGIGTTTPRGALDVNGNIVIDGSLIINNLTPASNSDDLLVRSKNSQPIGQLKILDVSERYVAPVNKYKVTITNIKNNNKAASEVLTLNTNLPTDKYVVAITDAVFTSATAQAVNQSNSKAKYGSYSTEITKYTPSGQSIEFYAVNLGFKGLDTYKGTAGQWEFSLIVYEKSLVKDWGTKTGSVSKDNNYSGVSTNTPDALK